MNFFLVVFLVYGFLSEGHLHANSCSRTRLLSNAADDIIELGRPETIGLPSSPRCGGPTAAVVLQTFMFLFIGMFLLRSSMPGRKG